MKNLWANESINSGDSITLNDFELSLCKLKAQERMKSNRSLGKHFFSKSNRTMSPFDVDFCGACGEMAFAKLANVYMDCNVDYRKGGYDIMLGTTKVDIKTTKYDSGKLYAKKSKENHDTDMFVLMTGQAPTFTFRGWCYSECIFNDLFLTSSREGDTYIYVMRQDKLRHKLSLENIT